MLKGQEALKKLEAREQKKKGKKGKGKGKGKGHDVIVNRVETSISSISASKKAGFKKLDDALYKKVQKLVERKDDYKLSENDLDVVDTLDGKADILIANYADDEAFNLDVRLKERKSVEGLAKRVQNIYKKCEQEKKQLQEKQQTLKIEDKKFVKGMQTITRSIAIYKKSLTQSQKDVLENAQEKMDLLLMHYDDQDFDEQERYNDRKELETYFKSTVKPLYQKIKKLVAETNKKPVV